MPQTDDMAVIRRMYGLSKVVEKGSEIAQDDCQIVGNHFFTDYRQN